jgi:flagellar basal body P-ring formation chaperone FlgA
LVAHIILAVLFLTSSVLWGQEVRQARTPISREEIHQAVVAAFRQQGVSEKQMPRIDDIEVPAAVSALSGRTLRVADVHWEAATGRAVLRIECVPGECIPFLVAVRMEKSTLPSAVAPNPPAKRTRQRSAVRSGDHALAVFSAERMHLAAAVVCLDRGNEGDVIRVRNQDGHIFRARVSGPGLLEVLPQ